MELVFLLLVILGGFGTAGFSLSVIVMRCLQRWHAKAKCDSDSALSYDNRTNHPAEQSCRQGVHTLGA
jgi:hypothetical protein